MSDVLSDYRIVRQLGAGAGSQIFVAVERKSGKEVAIKRVPRRGPDDDRFLRQVEVEYEVCRSVEHPHLRKCYELRAVRKLLQIRELVLIMEFVDGLPLEQALPNRLLTFLALFERVAAGLNALHEAGYVHSDIKPHNIMLGRGGVVKVIDFGQACRIGQSKNRIQGTPDYIAPEQVRRMHLTQRTDVFNLGATMYWVLTGKNYPTELADAADFAAVKRRKGATPPAPVDLNPRLPLALSVLVMDCCAENPQERPADMRQVASRLDVVRQVWQKQLAAAQGRAGPRPTPPDEDVLPANGAGENGDSES